MRRHPVKTTPGSNRLFSAGRNSRNNCRSRIHYHCLAYEWLEDRRLLSIPSASITPEMHLVDPSAYVQAGSTTGQNLSHSWWLGGPYVRAASDSVDVTVDGTDSIAESNEAENMMRFNSTGLPSASLPDKFVWPLGGVADRDWSLCG